MKKKHYSLHTLSRFAYWPLANFPRFPLKCLFLRLNCVNHPKNFRMSD